MITEETASRGAIERHAPTREEIIALAQELADLTLELEKLFKSFKTDSQKKL
jgi:hypothetical protein